MALLKLETDAIAITLSGDAPAFSLADSSIAGFFGTFQEFHNLANVRTLLVRRDETEMEAFKVDLVCAGRELGGPDRAATGILLCTNCRPDGVHPHLPGTWSAMEQRWYGDVMDQIEVLHHQVGLTALSVERKLAR